MDCPSNYEEVIALYTICEKLGQSPAVYAFGDHVSLHDKISIDLKVVSMGQEHIAEEQEKAMRDAELRNKI